MMGLGESETQAPFCYRHLVMPAFLCGSTKDKAESEDEFSTFLLLSSKGDIRIFAQSL
jgi:hypothetical protein